MIRLSTTTHRAFAASIAGLVFLSAQVRADTRKPPTAAIKAALSTYAKAIGCQFYFDPDNLVYLDVDADRIKEFVALFSIDTGCAGGSATSVTALAVIDVDGLRRAFIRPAMSHPAAPSDFPRFVDRIFLRDGRLWYRAKDFDWSKDALCCPSIIVEEEVTLRETVVQVDEKRSINAWYWADSRRQ